MNEEMRKEFEEWCKGRWFINIEFSNGKYISQQTQMKWELWQASRESMKPIELPKKYLTVIDNECHYYNTAIEECENAIQQAGYKVAP